MAPLAIRLIITWCLCVGTFRFIIRAEPCVNETELLLDDELQKTMIENIKSRILWNLGMTEPPAVTIKKPVVPEFIIEQLALNDDRHQDDANPPHAMSPSDNYAETRSKEVIIFPEISNCSIWEEKNPSSCYIIQLSEEDVQGVVKSADLWAYIMVDSHLFNYSFAVSEEILGSYDNESILLNTTVSCNSSCWHKFDLSGVVQVWSHQRHRVHNIRVSCMNCNSSMKSLLSVEHEEKPVLVVHYGPRDTSVLSRGRRQLACDNSCCKQNFYLNFSVVGWNNWIIAPPGYDASYCRGSCVGNPNHLPSDHSTFQRQYAHSRGFDNFLKLCCGATEMEGIDILYVSTENGTNVVYRRTLLDMKVKKCNCVQSTR